MNQGNEAMTKIGVLLWYLKPIRWHSLLQSTLLKPMIGVADGDTGTKLQKCLKKLTV